MLTILLAKVILGGSVLLLNQNRNKNVYPAFLNMHPTCRLPAQELLLAPQLHWSDPDKAAVQHLRKQRPHIHTASTRSVEKRGKVKMLASLQLCPRHTRWGNMILITRRTNTSRQELVDQAELWPGQSMSLSSTNFPLSSSLLLKQSFHYWFSFLSNPLPRTSALRDREHKSKSMEKYILPV